MKRITVASRPQFNGQFDITRYAFCCLGCQWQIQSGYRARSDVGGAQALLECIAQAHREHLEDDHGDLPIDVEVQWGDGSTHAGGVVNADGSTQAALMAVRLPDWWVDR